MIEIHCTNCKELLQIDDAFAGGVCRCRHCGTIQTVPKKLKNRNGNGAVAPEAAAAGKSTQNPSKKSAIDTSAGSGTGLDELAGIVASSGLAASRLRVKEQPAQIIPPANNNKTTIILAAAGAVILLLVGIIVFMSMRNGGNTENGTDSTPAANPTAASTPKNPQNEHPSPAIATQNPTNSSPRVLSPNFLGQTLVEKSIVYVLDRGAASTSEHRLDLLKAALLNSVRSLGPDRKFAVVFWKVEDQPVDAYPAEGLRSATPENINELQKFLEDIYSVGQTQAPPSTKKAFDTGAEAVVLVPVKTFIEPGTHTAIVQSRGGSTARVYCFTLAQPDIAESFRKVASDTQGSYRDVSLAELKTAGQQSGVQ